MQEHDLNTQQQLADFAGVSKGLVNQWFNGITGLGSKPLLQLGKKTNFSAEWLAHGTGPKYKEAATVQKIRPIESNVSAVGQIVGWSDDTPPDPEEFALVPFYKDVALSAGTGTVGEEDYNGFKLAFAKSTLRKCGVQEGKAVCVNVSGDSMEPVLPDGATVAVDTGSRHIKDGQMYAIRHGELLRVKILRKNANGTVRIISFNAEAYPEETGALGEEVDIIGRVFASMVLYP
nr:helix-turn-helix transcriptional regulator [Neisseria sp. HSC-16F19]